MGQAWDPGQTQRILKVLQGEPFAMAEQGLEDYVALVIHLLETGTADYETLWAALSPGRPRKLFLERVAEGCSDASRHFPPPPLEFLSRELTWTGTEERRLLYELIGSNLRPEAIPVLTDLLLHEQDPERRRVGTATLKKLIMEAT